MTYYGGPVRVAYSDAPEKIWPDAPESYVLDIYGEKATAAGVPGLPPPQTTGPMDLVTVFTWSRMAGGICDDLKRRTMVFWVGTVGDYRKAGLENPERCGPTPWP